MMSFIKPRSGKNVKCKKINVIQIDIEGRRVYLALFAAKLFRLVFMLTMAEFQKFKLDERTFVILKNFLHCVDVDGIPVFKSSKTSTVASSKTIDEETMSFSNVEIENLRQIDILQYITIDDEEEIEIQPDQSTSKEPAISNMTLKQFLEHLKPQKLSYSSSSTVEVSSLLYD